MDGGAAACFRRADWSAVEAAGMPMDLVHRPIARESHTRVRTGIHKHPGEAAAVRRVFAENAREEKRFAGGSGMKHGRRSEEHTSELQSQSNIVCRLLLE